MPHRIGKRYKALLIIIITLLPLILSGCKSGDNLSNSDNLSNVILNISDKAYVTETVSIPSSVGEIVDNSFTIYNEKLFFAALNDVEGNEETHFLPKAISTIYSINIDGTELNLLPNYVPPISLEIDTPGGVAVRDMVTDNSGDLWIYENWSYYEFNLSDDYNRENDSVHNCETIYNGYTLRKLDSKGGQLLSVDLEHLYEGENLFIDAIYIDSDDNVYLSAYNVDADNSIIFMVDSDGRKQFELNVNNRIIDFYSITGNAVGFVVYTYDEIRGANRYLQLIDNLNATLGDTVPLPQLDGMYYSGSGGYDSFIIDITHLYGLHIGEDLDMLLNWDDGGINSNGISYITVLPDERIVLTKRSSSLDSFDIVILTEKSLSDTEENTAIDERTELVLATCGLYRMFTDAVNEFNSSNTDYYIRIENYSKYNTDGNPNGATMRLTMELIAGINPDIIDAASFPYKIYAESGYLVDIYEFIDSDPEFNRYSLMEGAFRAAEVDGKLPVVFPAFSINTIIGHPSFVGESGGWNIEEFESVLNSFPNAGIPLGNIDGMDFLWYAVESCVDDYIDWKNITARFESPEFIRLLELSYRLNNAVDLSDPLFISDEDNIANGYQIMINGVINDFLSVQIYKLLFGGDLSFKGYPAENRNGNSINIIESGFSISENSANKEAAWSFIRMFLDSDFQLALTSSTTGFPTNKAAFNYQATYALNSFGGEEGLVATQYRNTTQEDVDMVVSLINATAGVRNRSITDSIYFIISEDAADYFSGLCGVEEAASRIQSRTSVYLSERYG